MTGPVGLPEPGTLSALAIAYSDHITSMTIDAKLPGHTIAAWDELARRVDVPGFVRVGRFKEVMDWQQTIGLMDQWARIAEFSSTLRRVRESGNMVFLELDERNTMNGETKEMTTLTVFEFNDAKKIRRLDFFQ